MAWRGALPGFRLNALEFFLDEVDCALEVVETCGLGAIVGGDDEVVDVVFVVGEEGVDVGLIDEPCALGLGEDKVAEEEETEGGVEG